MKLTELESRAYALASEAHSAVMQVRKYTYKPYVEHPLAVAMLVKGAGLGEELVAAAFLHDVVEDTEYTLEDIREHFGERVAALVEQVTDVAEPHHGNRAFRKEMDFYHSAAGSPEAHSIKLADIIDNTKSIVDHDKDFSRVYLREIYRLLSVLKDGDAKLYARAEKTVLRAFKKLGMEPSFPKMV